MRHCLIIEDDDNATFIAQGLSERGWRVTICHDAADAAGQSIEQAWDVIAPPLHAVSTSKTDERGLPAGLCWMGTRARERNLSERNQYDCHG